MEPMKLLLLGSHCLLVESMIYYCASNSGDDYLYFKVFDNKEEAEEELRKWNETNTAKQQ